MTATRRTLTLVAAAALAVTAGGTVRATVVLALGFDELAAQADRVVLGDVTSVTARWVERDGNKTIETVIDISVGDELGNVSAAPSATRFPRFREILSSPDLGMPAGRARPPGSCSRRGIPQWKVGKFRARLAKNRKGRQEGR